MDSRGRRDFVCGKLAEQRKGIQTHHNRQFGRCDERIGHAGNGIYPFTCRRIGYRSGSFRKLEYPYSCSRRSYSQRWAFGRNNDDHFAGLGIHTTKSESQSGHDGRNHLARESTSGWRNQRKNSGRQTCRNQRNYSERRKQKRCGRNQTLLPERT